MGNIKEAAEESLRQNQNTHAVTTRATLVKTVGQSLKKSFDDLKNSVPDHIDAKRLGRIIYTEIISNEKLLKCTMPSLLGAVRKAMGIGMEPGPLQQCHFIPRKKKGVLECNFQMGYPGLLDLARNSGEILSVHAMDVRPEDEFNYEYGMNEMFRHKPGEDRGMDEKNILKFYAYARLKNGGFQFVVMSKAQVDKIRARSQAAENGPWVTDYVQMGKKTAIIQLCKLLPRSTRMSDALEADGDGTGKVFDADGKAADKTGVEDADFTPIVDPPAPEPKQPTPEELKEKAQAKTAQNQKPEVKKAEKKQQPKPEGAEELKQAKITNGKLATEYAQIGKASEFAQVRDDFLNIIGTPLELLEIDGWQKMNGALQAELTRLKTPPK